MWKTVKLGDVCTITNGSTPLRKEKRYWEEGNVPWFTIDDYRVQGKNITYTQQNVTQAAVDDKKVRLVPANSVLLCCTASIGEAAIARVEMATNQQFNALTPKSAALNSDYLYFVATTLTQTLLSVSGKTTINFISMGKLKEISIPLPPLAEQQRIVAKLDAAFAEIDTAIAATETKQAEVEKLKASLLSQSLNGDAVIGTTVKLGDVCDLIGGGTPKSNVKSYWEGDVQWLTPKDMGKLTSRYVANTDRKITIEGLNNSSAKLVPSQSVILSCRAPIGHVFINEVEMSFNQGCKGLITSEEITAEYLYYFLFSSKHLLNDLGTGTTFKEISGKTLSNVDISLPPLAEQQRIVAKLDAAFGEIDRANHAIAKAKENYTALKSAMLAQQLQPPQSEAA